MSELPYIDLDLAGNPFRATPENTELFTFSPYAKLWNGESVPNPEDYDHVFLTHSEDEERKTGAYILAPETVQALGGIIMEYGFPARLNQMTIQECDYNARQTFVEQNAAYEAEDMGDYFPSDWDE